MKKNNLVAVVYPFVPHYRSAIMKRLVNNTQFPSDVVCSEVDPVDGIKTWLPEDSSRHIRTKTLPIRRPLHWQTGLFTLACGSKYGTLIFRGNVYCLSTWYAAPLARLFGKKILFWGHGWTRRDKGIKKWVRQMFYRLPNGFLYYGKTGRDIGVEFGFDENRAFVINNSQEMLGHRPLSHTARRKIKEQFFAEPVKPVVICSTRLAKRKKLHLLVEAIGLLEPSLRPNLILVGDGPERDRLKGLSNSLGVNCYMPGACYDEETLRDMFSCATVSVCPAAVGLTAIHSMNYGVPMLTDDCFERHGPEFEAIIPGRTGDFFEAGSIDAMASAIAKWTKNEFAEDDICSSCVNLVNDYYSPEFQEKMIIEAVQELSSE